MQKAYGDGDSNPKACQYFLAHLLGFDTYREKYMEEFKQKVKFENHKTNNGE
jgi:hypothetical protein